MHFDWREQKSQDTVNNFEMKGTGFDGSEGQFTALDQCAEAVHAGSLKITEHHSYIGRIIIQVHLNLSIHSGTSPAAAIKLDTEEH